MTARESDKNIQISTWKIVFVLGGPGSGKGTQCKRLVDKYSGLQHLSVGDVLRAERALPGSEYADTIAENMRLGRVGPMEITVKLLSRAMSQAAAAHGINTFLIDAFPRKMDQFCFFEGQIRPATAALFLECSPEVRRERLLQRGKTNTTSRQDDDLETIQKRFLTFENTSMEVINCLDGDKRLMRIQASQGAQAVFEDTEKALNRFLDLEEKE